MTTAPETVIAVDIGGTKIAAALVDEDDGIRERIRIGTPSGAAAILDAVARLITELRFRTGRPSDVRAVGIGAPGVIDSATGMVLSATEILPGWAGTGVRAELTEHVGLPIAVINDVRAAALGAVRDPALRECPEILHVSVGTGVGGALVRHGRTVAGPHGVTGELGHLLVPAIGALPCGCGRFDHLEAVVAGPAIAAAYARGEQGPARPLTEVTARMLAGDQRARMAILTAAELLGRALAGLVAAMDVDALTLGGGVVHSTTEFAVTVRRAFSIEALPPLRELPVLVPRMGTDAPLLGAAQLAREMTYGATA